MSTQLTGTVGNGTTVHLLSDSVSHRPLCGSGNNTIGTRKAHNGHVTGQPVTCKKCLKEMEQHKQIEEFLDMVDTSEKIERLEDLDASLQVELLDIASGESEHCSMVENYRLLDYRYDLLDSDDMHTFLTPRGAVLVADYQRRQAVTVDAGQQVADLKAENERLRKDIERLRKDIEHLRKIMKAATEYANAHFYAEPQWKINRLFEDMCSAMDTPEEKQS